MNKYANLILPIKGDTVSFGLPWSFFLEYALSFKGSLHLLPRLSLLRWCVHSRGACVFSGQQGELLLVHVWPHWPH